MRQRIAIEDVRAPSHRYGDPVYKRTSIFRLRFPLEQFWGRLPGLDLVAYMRKGVCITRKYVKPNQPKTPIQLTRQEVFKSIQRRWQTLSEEVLLAWKAYALKFIPQKPTAIEALAGFNAWVQTQTYRLGMGGQFGAAPPDHGLPPALRCLTQEVAPGETSYAFRVEHRVAEGQLEGKRLLVEITPAMPSLRRKPRVSELAWATADTRCFMELKPSGAVYLLLNARFRVAQGQRYGARVRLVTTDGVPGPAMFANFLKEISPEAEKDLLPEPQPPSPPEPELTPAELLEVLLSGISNSGAHSDELHGLSAASICTSEAGPGEKKGKEAVAQAQRPGRKDFIGAPGVQKVSMEPSWHPP